MRPVVRRTARAAGTAVGLAAMGYLAMVAWSWVRYGRPRRASDEEHDPLLDEFMPVYDIVERHSTPVAAPPEVTMAAAAEMDMAQSWVSRVIFRTRELVLGARPQRPVREGLVQLTRSMGWGTLAEVPGRELIMGAVTQPWSADVVFRPIPAAAFRDFNEPGYVKIVWTLRADPTVAGTSVFRSETRAVATDSDARRRFRWYWARFSPGIALIRRMMLGPMKADAERRVPQSK